MPEKNDTTKVIIFGAGKTGKVVFEAMDCRKASVVAFVDNKLYKQGSIYDNIPVINENQITDVDFDYILIGSMHFANIEKTLLQKGIAIDKIVRIFEKEVITKKGLFFSLCSEEGIIQVINYYYKFIIERLENKYKTRISNYKYENYDHHEIIAFPTIRPFSDIFTKLNKGASLIRFGDGEFEIMNGRNRAKFQKINDKLADRLKQLITVKRADLMVAIADNYKSLEKYTVPAADAIREYMTPEVRCEHMKFLDVKQEYYDAYVTRPYILYKDKSAAKDIFNEWKAVWENKHVVIVEGEGVRFGVGNDLLKNTKSIERIICPSENAFDYYDEIRKECLTTKDKSKLFLVALGPTATVLAYALYQEGYQAIDIGHLDLEYEWYNRKALEKINIPNRYVNEISGGDTYCSEHDEKYVSEIRCKIGEVDG